MILITLIGMVLYGLVLALERMLVVRAAHFSSSGCWNTMPMSRAGSNGCARVPIDTRPES